MRQERVPQTPQFSRRDFLRFSALTGAAAVLEAAGLGKPSSESSSTAQPSGNSPLGEFRSMPPLHGEPVPAPAYLPKGENASLQAEETVKLPQYELRELESNDNTNIDNRITIVVTGDGYTAAEKEKFFTDASSMMQEAFTTEPFSRYRNLFKVILMHLESPESGASHPPYKEDCGYNEYDCCPYPFSDPKMGTIVDTALDSTYCSGNYQGLHYPTESWTKILLPILEKEVPNWNLSAVLVNDDTPSGSASFPTSTSSLGEYGVNILLHELFGHGFNLDEEYEARGMYCSDLPEDEGVIPACAANVTNDGNEETVKWRYWIDGTVENQKVGVFLVNNNPEYGYHVSEQEHSIMGDINTRYFNKVSKEAIVQSIMRGIQRFSYFRGPLSLIDSVSHPSDTLLPSSELTTLEVQTVKLFGDPPLQIQWQVNGEVVAENTTSLSTSLNEGDVVVCKVTDPSPYVHPDCPEVGLLTQVREWVVQTPATPTPTPEPRNNLFIPVVKK